MSGLDLGFHNLLLVLFEPVQKIDAHPFTQADLQDVL